MENLLPVHLLKLRWLMSQIGTLSDLDVADIRVVNEIWEAMEYKTSYPFSIAIIDSIYDRVRASHAGQK